MSSWVVERIVHFDYDNGRLFVPTDLAGGSGDLVVLRRSQTPSVATPPSARAA